MASYTLNPAAVEYARRLIDARQYVLESDWGEAQPRAEDENRFLASHPWDDYSAWHLGLTDGATDETKGRYAFVYGDFRRVHRMGLIACQFRAAEWRHKEIELAAHDLLQHLDGKRA
jgi:hypothetical protein